MKYKNNITDIRNSIRMTQRKISEKAGISLQQAQNIEYGISAPSIYVAKKIADALNRSVDEVFPVAE